MHRRYEPRNIPIENLRSFVTILDAGSFTKAAERLHIVQSGVSTSVRSLEREMGAALFDRTTQPATLTEAGNWFRDVAQETLARVARLPEAAQQVASGASATLRFAATHALSLTFLPAWLRGRESRTPIGPVQLVSDMLQPCETLMQQGRAQFLLCHAHAQVPGRLDGAGFVSVAVGSDALLPVCATIVDAGASAIAARRRFAVLDYSAESGLGRLVRTLRTSTFDGVEFETVFTAHLATVLRTMALQGRGIAWLPRSLVEDDLRAGRLVEATALSAPLQVDIRLYRRDAPEPEAAERFWRAVTADA